MNFTFAGTNWAVPGEQDRPILPARVANQNTGFASSCKASHIMKEFIIQHNDTLPKNRKKTIDIHRVYPMIYISYTCKLFLKKIKRLVNDIFSSNFVLLSMC